MLNPTCSIHFLSDQNLVSRWCFQEIPSIIPLIGSVSDDRQYAWLERLKSNIEETNRVASWWFAFWIPVQTKNVSWKDLVLPISTHVLPYTTTSWPFIFKKLAELGTVFAEIITLPVRLITFIPRHYYNQHLSKQFERIQFADFRKKENTDLNFKGFTTLHHFLQFTKFQKRGKITFIPSVSKRELVFSFIPIFKEELVHFLKEKPVVNLSHSYTIKTQEFLIHDETKHTFQTYTYNEANRTLIQHN